MGTPETTLPFLINIIVFVRFGLALALHLQYRTWEEELERNPSSRWRSDD